MEDPTKRINGANHSFILIVEDNPADVGLIREALEEHGVDCDTTVMKDGATAIQLIADVERGIAACPDLIILDLNLPKRSGREVLARLRSSAKCQDVQTVILTSSEEPKDREDCARLGVTRYLRKPLRLDEFMNLGGVFKELLAEA